LARFADSGVTAVAPDEDIVRCHDFACGALVSPDAMAQIGDDSIPDEGRIGHAAIKSNVVRMPA